MVSKIDSENKKIIFDFGYFQNVKYKNDLSSLDYSISQLNIRNVNNFNDFISYLNSTYIENGFICLLNDKTRKISSKDKDIFTRDAILRVKLGAQQQDKIENGVFLGFFGDIDADLPVFKVKNIFTTRLNDKPQDFESVLTDVHIRTIKNMGEMKKEDVLSTTIFNSKNLSEIKILLTNFNHEKEKWNEYLNFLTDLNSVDMKYSVPFLNMKSVEIYKVQDLESDSELLEISEENLNSNESYFFQKKAISILEKNNINYFKTFLLEVDGIFFENDKSIKKLMKKEDLALVSFNTNARNKNFEIDKTTIFNFLLDKNYMNNQISEVSNFLKLSSTKIPLEVYLKNNNFTKLGIIDNLEKNDFFKLNNSKIFVKKFYLELESEEILNKTLENFKNDNFCGYLTKLDIGSTVLIERMRDVLKKISDGNTKNPYLANYLFNTKLIELVEPENNLEYANMEFKFNLNEEQKRAVHKAINSKDIFLVQGPPGTGKTQLICEIISQLNKMNRKIVITSQNHEAIKNVLDRLPNNPDNSKVRFANKYQSSINNFSVDKVVENYYSSLLKTVNQNMDNFESKLDSLESYKNKIENLFLNSETFTKLNSEISKINNEIDKINEELSNVNLQYEKNKLNSTRQKDTLENIKIISYCLNKNIFEVTSSEDDVMKEWKNKNFLNYVNEISNIFEEEFLITSIIKTCKNIFESVKLKSKFFSEVIQMQDEILREDDLIAKIKLEEELKNKISLLDNDFYYNAYNKFKNKILDDLKKISKTFNTNDEIKNDDSLKIRINELIKSKTVIIEKNKSIFNEIKNISKIVESEHNLKIDIYDDNFSINIRKQLQNLEKEYKKLIQNKKKINPIVDEFISFANNNYSYDNYNENFTNKKQLVSDTRKYHNYLFDNIVNIFALTLTSNDKFSFENSEHYKNIGIENISLKNLDVDTVIIDEASKATLIEILIPLIYGKNIILVGDYRQLPPILKLQPWDVENVNESLQTKYEFNSLYNLINNSTFKNFISTSNKTITTMLTKQYRFNEDIMKIVNKFYDNQLKVDQKISDSKQHGLVINNYLGENLINDRSSVYWVNSENNLVGKTNYEKFLEISTSIYNDFEIELTLDLIKKINKEVKKTSRKDKPSLAVISFYGLHVKKLKESFKEISKDIKNIEVIINTVDDFQGKEADYSIINLVRNPKNIYKEKGRDFLKKYERINVAFSRARELMIIVGSRRTIQDIEVEIPNIENPNILNRIQVYEEIYSELQFKGAVLSPNEILDKE